MTAYRCSTKPGREWPMNRQEMKAGQLALDRKHGASFLLRQALLILKDEAAELPCGDWLDYLEQLTAMALRLQEIRPAMAAIKNGLQVFIDGMAGLKAESVPFEPVDSVARLVESILHSLDLKFHDTVMNGAELIKPGDQIISCSFSATVCSALIQASAAGRSFAALIVDEQSQAQGLKYGEMMASALQAGGVGCDLVAEDRLDSIQGVSLGLVGADSVLSDGSLINGYPSLQLARTCFERQIPFYCLCESHKLASSYPPLPLEEGFDLIPATYVTAVVTEKGIISFP